MTELLTLLSPLPSNLLLMQFPRETLNLALSTKYLPTSKPLNCIISYKLKKKRGKLLQICKQLNYSRKNKTRQDKTMIVGPEANSFMISKLHCFNLVIFKNVIVIKYIERIKFTILTILNIQFKSVKSSYIFCPTNLLNCLKSYAH